MRYKKPKIEEIPMTELHTQHCQAYKDTPPLNADGLAEPLRQVKEWQLRDDNALISKSFRFKNYHQTSAFINAVIFIAHQQDHHPDISFGYNNCTICFSTHSIGGLSLNDFICAARIDALST